MLRRCLAIIVCLLSLGPAATSARADADADKAAITARLQRWTTAFNARDAAGICDLFAPDLVSTVPESLAGSRDALCSRLDALLAKPGLGLHYDNPDIREIIVSGDLAVVRLFWTLTARKGAEQDTTTEAGMDIFKRQPDGVWSIARFISFSIRPNKVLE
jgi:steroid delta-isomerase